MDPPHNSADEPSGIGLLSAAAELVRMRNTPDLGRQQTPKSNPASREYHHHHYNHSYDHDHDQNQPERYHDQPSLPSNHASPASPGPPAGSPAASRPSDPHQPEPGPENTPLSDHSTGPSPKHKKKRKKVNQACVYCRRSHMTCDLKRPCQRCVKRSIGHLCRDEPPRVGRLRESKKASRNMSISESESQPAQADAGQPQGAAPEAGPALPTPPTLSFPAGEGLEVPSQVPLVSQMSGPSAAVTAPTSQAPGWNQPSASSYDLVLQEIANAYFPFNSSEMTSEFHLLNDFFNTIDPYNLSDLNTETGTSISGPGQGIPPVQFPNTNQISYTQDGRPQPNQFNAQNGPFISAPPGVATADIDPNGATASMAHFANPSIPDGSMGSNQYSMLESQASIANSSVQPDSGRLDFINKQSEAGYKPPNQPASSGQEQRGEAKPPNHNTTDSNSSQTATTKERVQEYYKTAADPAGTNTPEARMRRVLEAKYKAGLLRPFNYAKGYERLKKHMEKNYGTDTQKGILQCLEKLRPKFRERMSSMTDVELVLVEMRFERKLIDFDRMFSFFRTPMCCWRRTGEIVRGNEEMAALINVSIDALRDGQIAIHQILSEQSISAYWGLFSSVAFDVEKETILTTITLKHPSPDPEAPVPSATAPKFRAQRARGSLISVLDKPELVCGCSLKIKRDETDIPSLIVANFIPHLENR